MLPLDILFGLYRMLQPSPLPTGCDQCDQVINSMDQRVLRFAVRGHCKKENKLECI